MKFKIGDKVKIKNSTYYGYKKKWIVAHIYKNGDIVLRNENTEYETIERYSPDDLEKRDDKK